MAKRLGSTARKQALRHPGAWFVIVPLLALLAEAPGRVLALPAVAFAAIAAGLVWRARGRASEALRALRPLLRADETVFATGVGRASGVRGADRAFRLVVATDRRVIVTGSTRSTEALPLVDVPYSRLSRFGLAWKYGGHVGELSLTLEGLDGAPSETHVVDSFAPADLVSMARALRAHGVPADEPGAVTDAEVGWEEVRAAAEALGPHEPRKPLFDRAAMNTPEFDRGLWVLLGLSTVIFYGNTYGLELDTSAAGVLVTMAIPVLSGICAYVSRTRSSLAYLVPLNLLVAPGFFFDDPSYVIGMMVAISVLAAAGLWAGSALRVRGRGADAPVPAAGARAPRGTLRYTIGGESLVRLSGMLLAAMATLVVTTSAAGFELPALRLALDEATLTKVPVDGRSNLIGGAASLTYTRGPDLHEFITDNLSEGQETDGARWELRSSFTKGYNVVSLASYIPEPSLADPAAVTDFVARKDREHAGLAGHSVTHTERVVDGRRGYVWEHGSRRGYWYYAAWFPTPVHTVGSLEFR
jgi:hypothetical protein